MVGRDNYKSRGREGITICGIFGVVGSETTYEDLYKGLNRLSYRGYDSFGIGALHKYRTMDDDIEVIKSTNLLNIKDKIPSFNDLNLSNEEHRFYLPPLGIGHTRWSTHGKASEENAHPHLSNSGRFAIVHNGTLNAEILKKRVSALEEHNYELKSETDSEILVNCIELSEKTKPCSVLGAIRKNIEDGNAFLLIDKKEETLWAVCQGNRTLYVTLNGYVSSDLESLSGFAVRALRVENAIFRVTNNLGWTTLNDLDGGISDYDNDDIVSVPKLIEFEGENDYMRAEIQEQSHLNFKNRPTRKGNKGITFIACGSSYYACLFGRQIIENQSWGVTQCLTEYATEFISKRVPENKEYILVSQSGLSQDTLTALDYLDYLSIKNISCITNNTTSTLANKTDFQRYLNCGVERGVAATKTFVATCLEIYSFYNHGDNIPKFLNGVNKIVRDSAFEGLEKEFAKLAHFNKFIFLGSNYGLPIALEGALKIKEVAQLWVDAMPAGECRHGPISLVDNQTLSVFILTKGLSKPAVLSNIIEIASRGSKILAIYDEIFDDDLPKEVTYKIRLPTVDDAALQALMAVVPLQIMSYAISREKGLNPNRPKNICKVVTV